MNPSLQQAELTKRQKELDAREAFLDEKLKLLEDAPLNLKIYDERVNAKERELEVLQSQINDKRLELDNLIQEFNQNQSKLKQRLLETQLNINKAAETLTNIKFTVRQTEDRLKSLNSEIKERQNYQLEQEEQINIASEAGNDRILSLKDEIARLELDINDLKSIKLELKTEIDDLKLIKENLEVEYANKEAELSGKTVTLREQIKALETSLIETSREYTKVKDDTDAKLKTLQEKESSLIAKSDAIILERQELERDKSRFQATRSLYEQ